MRIDNSAAKLFKRCPGECQERYFERYPGADEIGIESNRGRPEADFGGRMHNLLARHRGAEQPDVPLLDHSLENEAQACLAAYKAHYPTEPYETLAVEQTRIVNLPILCGRCYGPVNASSICENCDQLWTRQHELVVKIDWLVRNKFRAVQILDTKTQGRDSNNNDPEHWAARPQVSLYLFASRQLWPDENVSDEVVIDLIRRQSPKGNAGPEFHRDHPRRTPEQIQAAVREIVYVADRIEECQRTGFWPRNTENCKIGRFKCDYFDLHVPSNIIREDVLRRGFKPAEPYLELP